MSGQIVIVGASLAGLRAAEALRDGGYVGRLVIVGDEPHRPYDRPPLSKQVALGGPARTTLPRARDIDADWRLGTAATGLDLAARRVALSHGAPLGFDRLLIATGTRARPFAGDGAALDGVMTLRTREDATALRDALAARPRRVVVVGGGFNGCEIASACRALDLPVTLVERAATPLAAALGATVGAAAAALQRAHGVDLRCGHRVTRLEGDGRVRRAILDDGTAIDADLVVVALGSLPNVEWLEGCGLAAGPKGLACDAACRAFDLFGIATDDIHVAGDVARFPHPLFNYEFLTLEHWGNAVEMARVAAHNMLAADARRRPHLMVPAFWSSQHDVSIKSVGVPAAADTVAIVQGSLERGAFVALYGCEERLVAAVGFDQGRWLQRYVPLIEAGAPFPGPAGMDPSPDAAPMPPAFPHPAHGGLDSTITLSGHAPAERHAVVRRRTA